jgi:DNA repair protein RadA/Sms
MAQPALKYACSECGQSTGRWLGRCPGCGSFGTLVEEAPPAASRGKAAAPRPVLRRVDGEGEEAERLPETDRECLRALP